MHIIENKPTYDKCIDIVGLVEDNKNNDNSFTDT